MEPESSTNYDKVVHTPVSQPKWTVYVLLCVCISITIFIFVYTAFARPPASFPVNIPITIEEGMDVNTIVELLREQKVVRSADLLYVVLLLFHDATKIKAGIYTFGEPLSVNEVAIRITDDVGPIDPLVSITFPEGITVSEIADIASEKIVGFDAELFEGLAQEFEGMLFPDTFFIPADYSEEELLTLLRDTHTEKLTPYLAQINSHDLTEYEIMTLASIIEREANTPDSMKTIAGIFFNRLNLGMALQADASIGYVLHKSLEELTPEDLEIDSRYNTYLYRGLPPTPIGNPGLQSIDAVLNPTVSDYYYYLTDETGAFHYARTYAEHTDNIERYLR